MSRCVQVGPRGYLVGLTASIVLGRSSMLDNFVGRELVNERNSTYDKPFLQSLCSMYWQERKA